METAINANLSESLGVRLEFIRKAVSMHNPLLFIIQPHKLGNGGDTQKTQIQLIGCVYPKSIARGVTRILTIG